MRARAIAERLLLPTVTLAVFLAGWWAAVAWTGTKVFPSPLAVIRGAREFYATGLLLRYALDSLRRVGLAFVLAVALGIPTGMLMGLYAPIAALLGPVLRALRPISPLAWVPIVILLFGVGDVSGVVLIFSPAFFQLALTTSVAVSSVPEMYMNAGRNFGLSGPPLFWRIILPATLPTVLTGLRMALWVAWQVMVAAEMIAVDSGLGYMIIDARNAGKRYDLVVAAMVIIGAIGLVLDALMRWVETFRSVRWAFREER